MAIEVLIDRRGVLAGLAGSAIFPSIPFAADGPPAFLACCRVKDGGYAAAALDRDANHLFTEHLDGRGHDIAASPDGRLAVVFARRPGRFALVLDLDRRQRRMAFAPPPGRHFYGHGFFTPDGRLLYATENDYEAERGVLGVYDVEAGFTRIGEIATGGIGPHEALLMSDGKTIAVANGGIATHPDFPRQKLNLATMAPSIAYLDIGTGDLIDRVSLPAHLHQLSLRHMAEAGDGTIWFGGQYEGPETDAIPLVGSHTPGADVAFADAPEDLYRGMNHYVGSVASSRDGQRIATTSPRGGRLVIWDAARRIPVETHEIADVCGVAPRGADYLSTDGHGHVHGSDGSLAVNAVAAWDNHLTAIRF